MAEYHGDGWVAPTQAPDPVDRTPELEKVAQAVSMVLERGDIWNSLRDAHPELHDAWNATNTAVMVLRKLGWQPPTKQKTVGTIGMPGLLQEDVKRSSDQELLRLTTELGESMMAMRACLHRINDELRRRAEERFFKGEG